MLGFLIGKCSFFHFSCVINFPLAVLDVEFDRNSSPGGYHSAAAETIVVQELGRRAITIDWKELKYEGY